MFKYFPHTKKDIEQMLNQLNLKSVDELFNHISKDVLLKKDYDLPSQMSEIEIRNYFKSLSDENKEMVIFSGRSDCKSQKSALSWNGTVF